jgi:hypothetical protein
MISSVARSSQAQPNQPQQTAQSSIAQAIINVAQAVINIANATTSSSSSSNNQNGPRVQRTHDFFEARTRNRNSREQEEHDRTLYRRRNRRPSDTTAYSNALASRNASGSANNQNPLAQNSMLDNLLQTIQRAMAQPANNPVAPGQNPGPGPVAQPAQNNNILITLNNNASRFSNALNIATTALGQFNQQLAAGMTQNSVFNNGSGSLDAISQFTKFTQTFQSLIDQLKNINPVINMRGTHTVVVEFGASAGVFASMENKLQEFVVNQVNAGLNNVNNTLMNSTEGSINNVRNLA